MGFITNKNMTGKLMICLETGKLFSVSLSKEEKADVIFQDTRLNAEDKLNKLQDLGFDLEEILEMALMFEI